jgi:hypothetical protein
VTFNGGANPFVSVVTINDSFNVASVARNATGDYTINWITPFANANYAVSGMAMDIRAYSIDIQSVTPASIRILLLKADGNVQIDRPFISLMAVGRQ